MRVLLALVLGCAQAGPEPVVYADVAAPPEAVWPAAGTVFRRPQLELPGDFAKKRIIIIDAGHGAGANKNRGTTTVFCEKEEAFTLRVAEAIAPRLQAMGPFDVRLSREAEARRGSYGWSPKPGVGPCPREDFATGFAILWSDEGSPEMSERRSKLATSIADRMAATGFVPYDGQDYVALYAPTAGHPGTFVDRHEPSKRIMTLRRLNRLPAVIVETHQAWNLDEALRWRESATLDAFADALAVALIDALQ